MKLALQSFTLGLVATTSSVCAILECNNTDSSSLQASNTPPSACAHFEGIQTDGYIQWYNDNDIGAKYSGVVYLPGSDPTQPENGAAVFWAVDNDYVSLAVAVRAKGWVGFGISEAGGMRGTDMALFTAEKPDEIVDAYTTDQLFPQIDDCSSDWELIDSNVDVENGFIMIEFKRLLDTGDSSQDKRIVNDTSIVFPAHRIIAAWGDSAEVGYHGLNRARGAVRFFGTEDEQSRFDQVMAEQAEGNFYVASKNHSLLTEETEYFTTCVSRQDLIDQGVPDTNASLSIIGFEPVIQEGNEAYVHHYVVSGSQQGNCTGEEFDEIVFVWAPGEGAFTLPEYLGTPLFGIDGFQAFEIEVHYDNPLGMAGVTDSSGVRVYWTSEPREYEMGVMATGDPSVSLSDQAVGDGVSLHTFECPGSCSSLIGQPVTVIREYLHLHQTGARITNEMIRDGNVIRTAVAEYFDFDQNGNIAVQQDSFDVQPGDGFRTSCYYNGEGRVFGLASSQEMCMAFIYYYPRKKIWIEEFGVEVTWTCGYEIGIAACETTYETAMFAEVEEIGRSFGYRSAETCKEETNEKSPEDDVATADGTTQAASSGFIIHIHMFALLTTMVGLGAIHANF